MELHAKQTEDNLKNRIGLLSKQLNDEKIEMLKWKENYEKEKKEKNDNLATIAKLHRKNNHLTAQVNQISFSLNHKQQNEEKITKNEELINSSIQGSSNDENVYEVEKLLSDKIMRKKQHFLVRWKGFDETHDSWVQKENLNCPKILQKYFKTKTQN